LITKKYARKKLNPDDRKSNVDYEYAYKSKLNFH